MNQLTFKHRRIVGLLITAIAIGVVWLLAWVEESRLGHASYLTGFTCLAALFVLILLGMRRRLPMLPLGSVSTWTQVHLYTGIFATGVFVLHVPALVAGGLFEFTLSLVFWAVSISGFYGVYISRTLPKRLTAVQGQHRFDRVAWHRSEIADRARALLAETANTTAGSVLEQFYRDYLKQFFGHRPSLAYVLIPTGHRRQRLLNDLKELDRYLEADSKKTAGRFAALVRKRDDLDYQFALQFRLRSWVVFHAFFSIVLTIGAIVHGVMALRFTI